MRLGSHHQHMELGDRERCFHNHHQNPGEPGNRMGRPEQKYSEDSTCSRRFSVFQKNAEIAGFGDQATRSRSVASKDSNP